MEARRRPRRPRRRRPARSSPRAAASCRCWPTRSRSPPRPAPAARQAQGPDRPRVAGPAALRRPDRQPGGAADGRAARRGARVAARRRCTRAGFIEVETPVLQPLHGGANARPFVTHINAYDMHALPADRAGAVPQAAGRRRHRAGLRDRPELPQRGRRRHPQPRVHHARGLPGLRRLRHDGDADPGADPGRGAGGARLDRRAPRRRRASTTSAAVALGHGARGGLRGARRAGHPRHRRSTSCAAVPRSSTCRCSRRGTAGQVVLEMYERLVEKQTVEPTFYRDFPVEVSPLTRAHRTTRGWPSGGTWWRSAPSSAPPTPSWSTRSSSAAADRAVAARRGRRPRGDAARRGLPARPGIRACRRPAAWAWASTGC